MTKTAVAKANEFPNTMARSAALTSVLARLTPREAEASPIPANGGSYAYNENPSGARQLPHSFALIPRTNGTTANFDLSLALCSNHFAV